MTHDPTMNGLKLVVKPGRGDVIYGESLEVAAEVRNEGEQAVELSLPELTSPVEYELRSSQAPEGLRLSDASFRQALNDDDMRPPEPMQQHQLAPGETLSLGDDLTQYGLGALVPGTWKLTAHLRQPVRLDSEPVEVHVRAAKVEALETVLCPLRGQFVSAMVERGEGGPLVLHRTSATQDPRNGVFRRGVPPKERLPGDNIAIAVHTSEECTGRLVAWTGGGQLQVVFTFAKRFAPLAAAPVSPGERVLAPGFQFPERSADFFLLEEGEDGAKVRLFHVRPEGVQAGPAMRLSGQSPGHVRVRALSQGTPSQYELVWTETSPGRTRVLAATYEREKGACGPVRQLFDRAEPLVALEVPALGPGRVHALFGPDRKRKLAYVTATLEAKSKVQTLPLSAPEETVTEWSLVASEQLPPVVAAMTAGGVLVSRVGASWSRLASTKDATRLRLLFEPSVGLFAEFVEPALGVRHVQVKPAPK